MPRVIAALLAVDGLACLAYSVTDIVSPGPASLLTPWVQLLAPLAEGALSLWLLAFGVDDGRRTRPAVRTALPSSDPGAAGVD